MKNIGRNNNRKNPATTNRNYTTSEIQLKKSPDMQKSRQNMTNNRRKYNQQKQTQAPYTLVSTLDSETDTEMTEMPELSDKDITTAVKNMLHMFQKKKT